MNCNCEQNAIVIVRGNDTDWNGANFLTINLIPHQTFDLATCKAVLNMSGVIKEFDDLSSGSIEVNLTAQETKNLPPFFNGVLNIIDNENKIATITSFIPFKVISTVANNAIATEPYTLNFDVKQGGETILTVNVESAVSVEVGQTTTLPAGSDATVTNSGTGNHLVLDFGIPKGDGIASIEKTSTSGLIDIYTVTFDTGNTTTFEITNGNGILSVSKTSTSGLVDTYTITFDNGNSTTFTVTNGSSIASIEKTSTSGLVDTYTVTLTNGDTSTFTVTNGQNATITGATATVNNQVGTPSVTVTSSGTEFARSFNFDFKNLKGEQGIQGIQGETGQTGATGNGIVGIEKTSTSGLIDTYTVTYTNTDTDTFTVTNGADGTNATITGATASVSNTVGIPSVVVTAGGTESARSFNFAFTNLKGDKGDTGAGMVAEVVAELPVTGETGKIYLVPKDTPDLQDIYDEWIWAIVTSPDTYGWEHIGSTDIDLTGYVQSVNNEIPDSNGNVTLSFPVTDVQVSSTSVVTSGVANITNMVTTDTYQTISAAKFIVGTDVTVSGNQANIFTALSTQSSSTAGWKGRMLVGAKNLTFLMGAYGGMAGLGAHSWSDAASGTGAAWADFYLNPDGAKTVYIGGYGWKANAGWFRVQNSGSITGGSTQVNKGTINSADWKDVAYKGENISDFSNDTGFITSSALSDYQTKATIVTLLATDNITIADNTIYNGNEQTALTIVLPTTNTDGFLCEIDFSSGASPTTVNYPSSIKWLGDDIYNNVFTPVVNKRYTIMCYYNGAEYVATVRGV